MRKGSSTAYPGSTSAHADRNRRSRHPLSSSRSNQPSPLVGERQPGWVPPPKQSSRRSAGKPDIAKLLASQPRYPFGVAIQSRVNPARQTGIVKSNVAVTSEAPKQPMKMLLHFAFSLVNDSLGRADELGRLSNRRLFAERVTTALPAARCWPLLRATSCAHENQIQQNQSGSGTLCRCVYHFGRSLRERRTGHPRIGPGTHHRHRGQGLAESHQTQAPSSSQSGGRRSGPGLDWPG
jgi:hypothetical protein